jgi:hypothetical protein
VCQSIYILYSIQTFTGLNKISSYSPFCEELSVSIKPLICPHRIDKPAIKNGIFVVLTLCTLSISSFTVPDYGGAYSKCALTNDI